MVECTQCGQRCEPSEQFCGSCGAYLEWTAPAAATSPQPAAAGAVPEQPAASAALPPPPSTSPSPAVPPPAAAAASVSPPAQGIVPVQPSAGPVQPQAGEARAPRPPTSRPPDEPPPAPGDLICGQCGVGNAPTRRFCRRCGTSLADAPVAPKAAWWRRLFAPRPRTAPAAGERPAPGLLGRLRALRRPRLLVPLLVVALGIAGFALRSQLHKATDTVKDRVAKTQQVHAVAVTASSASGGHPAALAVDGTTDRYWAPAREGDGKGQYLEARFDEPFRLLDLIVYPGSSTVDQDFLTQARPRTLIVTVTDTHGKATRHTVNLGDSPGKQTFHIAESDVARIRLTINGAYGTGRGHHVAIGEVEFFKRG